MATEPRTILPSAHETVAIAPEIPKTAALCFDRVWGTPQEFGIPEELACFGSTSPENWLAACKAAGEPLSLPLMFPPGHWPPGHWAPGHFPEDPLNSERGLRTLTEVLQQVHGLGATPVYASQQQRDREFQPGDRVAIVLTLSQLAVVDEDALDWQQVLDFRADEEARRKYRRFLDWLNKEMPGKSQPFIEDEIAGRLKDYTWALKKHGIKTMLGIVQEALDGEFLVGIGAVTSPLVLAGHPTLGFLTGVGLVIGRVAVSLCQKLLDVADAECGPNRQISWVYEVKGRLGSHND